MRIKNLPSIESMDGSQDALIIEQTDGSEDKSRKVSPAQIKQYVLGDMDDVPTADSNNPVKSGGIFSTMAVPKYDSTNRAEYYEGGGAFGGNIDSTPTAGSNNAVASGGTKTYVDNAIAITKVPDTFITLESGISILNNGLYKRGNHVFGWITFGFSSRTPSNLKLGTINSAYRPSTDPIRMLAGLGTENWAAEYNGYAIKGMDHALSINGYNNNIKVAHIHLDYVIV